MLEEISTMLEDLDERIRQILNINTKVNLPKYFKNLHSAILTPVMNRYNPK